MYISSDDPPFPVDTLTSWAMPVSSAIIMHFSVVTIGASFFMSAQVYGFTFAQGIEYTQLLTIASCPNKF